MTTENYEPYWERRRLLARIHIRKKQLFEDDDTYRGFLELHTKKTSCGEMTLEEIRYIETKTYEMLERRSTTTEVLMTSGQAVLLERLCKRMGWEGINDIRLLSFAERTLKARFLNVGAINSQQASILITGLGRWVTQIEEGR